MIRFPCPKCRVILEVERAAVIRCPSCGQMCRLPESVLERPAPSRPEVDDRPKSSVRRRDDSASRRGEVVPVSPAPSSRKRRAPERMAEPEGGYPESSGSSTAWVIPFILLLGVVGMVTGVATLVLFVLHDGGITAMALGGLMAFGGWLWLVGQAAEDGELLPCLLIPFYSLLYTVRNLQTVGMAAFVQIVGFLMLSIGITVYENPDLLPEGERNYASGPSGPKEKEKETPVAPPVRREEDKGVGNPVQKPGPVATPQALPWMKREPVAPNTLQGLLAAWTFDEGEGTVVHDVAGVGLNGNLVGGKWVKGIKGNAIQLSGNGEYFDYGRSRRFDFPAEGTFTFAAWFQTRASRGDLLAQRNSEDGAPAIHVWLLNGTLHALVRQDGNEQGEHAEVHGDTVNDGEWHHFALTRNERGEVELFLDGKSQSKRSAQDSGGSISTDLRTVGSDQYRAKKGLRNYFAGSIDELCIFDRVLEPKEIEALTGQ
jgi:hypothetical protein